VNRSSPSAQEDLLAWLRLTLVPGVSSRMQHALLAAFGSPHAVVTASATDLRAVVDESAVQALARGADEVLVQASLAWLREPGRSLLTLADDDYPRALLEAGPAPCVLYVQGRRELLKMPAFAIVGSRNATPQGLRDARAFARTLSDAGLCVVSGLALGIDAAAHRGGIEGKSSSIAVMGTGPDRVYPAANRALAHELAQTGCVITEFPLGTAACAWNFPQRNRLISGLCRGVLVVEAAVESGSLITARLATEQGRDVFAVPGSIHSPLSKGCHALIRDGAKLVESAEDILTELGMPRSKEVAKATVPHEPLLQQMGFAPISIDEMVERTGIGAAELSSRLSLLEIEGRVTPLAGGRFQRVDETQ
jgi:DNA processing protein